MRWIPQKVSLSQTVRKKHTPFLTPWAVSREHHVISQPDVLAQYQHAVDRQADRKPPAESHNADEQ